MLKDRLVKLISVKSIVTILLTVLFGVLSITKDSIPSEVTNVYTVVIAFYFGTQAERRKGSENTDG